ncbi:hypothetical protein F511_36811 [Dorcoceras hygrometricum]|uniref:DUF7642 domain-containing protein n=1 Tax=Dorcoceras hygrometricum TaxID=472368 RepID=A0A2Z7DE20_9LAMI|nr:hypothetical protein F511_36811 [Dorcoceras hygrometricum]
MESGDGVAEINRMERGLLLHEADSVTGRDDGHADDQDPVLYAASFDGSEENFMNYQTAYWFLYSSLLLFAWGFGLLMLIYLPLRRYILRKDIRSRKLYVTPNAIVYKVRKPVAFPCFGFLEKEKYVLLPSVADVVIEQGYFQSLFDVYSVRIENVGVRRPASDDVKIQGVSNPLAFREAVLSQLSKMRDEVFSRHSSAIEEVSTPRIGHSSVALMSPSKSPGYDYLSQLGDTTILQKLEQVSSSVKLCAAGLLLSEQGKLKEHTSELKLTLGLTGRRAGPLVEVEF